MPGSCHCQSSYRGELGGILGTIVFTKYISRKWNVTSGKVIIGCDCQGALAAIKKTQRVISQWNSYDIVSRILREIQDSTITFTFQYIKGHQDTYKDINDLDEWEQANVHTDALAKRYLQLYGFSEQGYIPNIEPGDMWTICYDQEMIVTSDVKKRLYSCIWEAKGKSYWMRKLCLDKTCAGFINWEFFC